jgi:hypothetical protein
MNQIERYRTLRVICSVALVGSVLGVNIAFDAHSDAVMFVSIVAAFAAMFGILHSTRALGRHDLVMSDTWTPSRSFNPGSGLPMVDSFVDINGNLYGSTDSHDQRRGG